MTATAPPQKHTTGPHLRNGIRCGDARDVLPRLPSGSIGCIVTSPPYVDLRDYARIEPDAYVDWFLPIGREFKRLLTGEGNLFLNVNDRCHRGRRLTTSFELAASLIDEVGLMLVEVYIWHKPNARPGCYGKRAKDSFEYVFHFAKGRDHYFDLAAIGRPYRCDRSSTGDRPSGAPRRVPSGWTVPNDGAFDRGWADPGNVFTIPVARNNTAHTATMPGELARRLIAMGSRRGDAVLDPFCGSGTTCVEAVRAGRRYVGIEWHRPYAVMARRRVAKVRRAAERRGAGEGERRSAGEGVRR